MPNTPTTAGLFSPQTINRYLDERRAEAIPNFDARQAALKKWISDLPPTAKEGSLEQQFNQRVLGDVLGYQIFPDSAATAYPKAPSSLTGISGEPDVLLGDFSNLAQPVVDVVLELKPPGTPYDVPQQRPDKLTPVQQAFNYGDQILGVRWVIVSDMRTMRLYSIGSRSDYELFDLTLCVGDDPSSRDNFRKLISLLDQRHLPSASGDSSVSLLLRKSLERQIQIRNGFYKVYAEIREDIFIEIGKACISAGIVANHDELVGATQRLLDRMLFLYYCEDHPEKLIPPDTIKSIVAASRLLPGSSSNRVYSFLKALFREVDTGSSASSGQAIAAYNGELFKPHAILDVIDLPDSLADKTYLVVDDSSTVARQIRGAWGLHAFDFWRELNEHLLGHLFEQSLSEISSGLAFGGSQSKQDQRKSHGIFYTDELIADFLAQSAIKALIGERSAAPSGDLAADLRDEANLLSTFKIVDLACGSGAFLVSAYRELLSRHLSLQDGLRQIRTQGSLDLELAAASQASLLRDTLFGADLLPQAVELAKLALWLRSARKGEKVADLSKNLVVADSLDIPNLYAALNSAPGTFDLVMGNPPWGADVGAAEKLAACATLGLRPDVDWDSWELFLALGLAALKEGGRLALVLPDTILSPEKSRARELLLKAGRLEKFHILGPGWFEGVRMGSTVLVQLRRGPVPMTADVLSMTLAKQARKKAIEGKLPLVQLESKTSRQLPQERSLATSTFEIEPQRSRADDQIIATILSNSKPMLEVTSRARGEEISKGGLIWRCPSCLSPSTPATKEKGGGFSSKPCPQCGLRLDESNAGAEYLVGTQRIPGADPFLDGDDIVHRYGSVAPSKFLRPLPGIIQKPASIYVAPKILVRQAGIGLSVLLDSSGARCPQSVYVYRSSDPDIALEYLLAVLSSRTMAYFLFKRYGEIDPDRNHAKLTHRRLEELPIPVPQGLDGRRTQSSIIASVSNLLSGQSRTGGTEDMKIELELRALWGLTAQQGEVISRELLLLPDSLPLKELFPNGLLEQMRKAAGVSPIV